MTMKNVLMLKGTDGKPYTPKPEYNYTMNATVGFYALETSGKPVHTAKFQFPLDIKFALKERLTGC